jgi:hypothetical protein
MHCWNEEPVDGCLIGTQSPNLHSKYNQVYSIGFSDETHELACIAWHAWPCAQIHYWRVALWYPAGHQRGRHIWHLHRALPM